MATMFGGTGRSSAFRGRGSFAGLVTQLTSELRERIVEEHDLQVASLVREVDSLQVEVAALRSSTGALRLQLESSSTSPRRGDSQASLTRTFSNLLGFLDSPRCSSPVSLAPRSGTPMGNRSSTPMSLGEAPMLHSTSGPLLSLPEDKANSSDLCQEEEQQSPETGLVMVERTGSGPPVCPPIHEPTLQPQVQNTLEEEIPTAPSDRRENITMLSRRSRTRKFSLEHFGSADLSTYADGGRPDIVRMQSSTTRLGTSEVIDTRLFELRGTWLLDDDSIQRMRTKSSMLVVVEHENEKKEHRLRSKFARFIRSLSADSSWNNGRFIMHPQSVPRVLWDLATILLVAWDFVMVPLLLFFDPPRDSVVEAVDFASHIFWTVDIPATFFTGMFEGSRLVMRPFAIARRYAKTWLLMDLIIVVPEWVSYLIGGDGNITSSFSALKGLRAVRCLRLLRLLKLDQTLREFQVLINSNYLTLSIGIMKLIVTLVFTNHFIACCWYALGNAYSDGWVQFVTGEETNRIGQEPTTLYMYLLAMHWSLTQFHSGMELVPNNSQERAFAVVIILFALMCISCLLSSMTDMVIELQSLRRDEVKKERILRKYLWEHQISVQLGVAVKKYLQSWVDYRKKKESEYELFKVLPVRLLTDLHDEARSPVLIAHSLFAEVRRLNARACRHICHECIEEMATSVGEAIFTVGDACTRMLFIESGHYTYRKKRMSVGRLFDDNDKPSDMPVVAGEWVSEAALWTMWTNFGDFTTTTAGVCLALDAIKFARVVHQYEETFMQVALYGRRFVRYLNNNACGDVILSIETETISRSRTRRFSTSL